MKRLRIFFLTILAGVLFGVVSSAGTGHEETVEKASASHAAPSGFYTTVALNPSSARDNETVTITANICERRGLQDCIDHASQSLPPLRCDFYRSTPGQPANLLRRPEYEIQTNVQCSRPSASATTWTNRATVIWQPRFIREGGVNEEQSGIGIFVVLRAADFSGNPMNCPGGTGGDVCGSWSRTLGFRQIGIAPDVAITQQPGTVTPGASYSVTAEARNFSGPVTWQWLAPGTGISSCTTPSCTFSAPTTEGTYLGTARATAGTQTDAAQFTLTVGSGVQQPPAGEDCGCGRFVWSVGELVRKAICEATCAVSQALGGLVDWILNRLIDVSGVSIEPEQLPQFSRVCWLKLLI